MLGAIIGDIVGSAYEFHPTHDYNFEMFKDGSGFTDDTICTIAMADAVLKDVQRDSDGVDYGENLHAWCRRYPTPKGSYGGRFGQWVRSTHPQPYGSYGNGSAMRVSPIGMWYFDDPEAARVMAKVSASCTHNHPEGIKGAQAVAEAIGRAIWECDGCMNNDEACKKAHQICAETLMKYGYPYKFDYEEYRGRFDETCQGTVPVALCIIQNSISFEDAIRRAVSLAADADTLGAIVGSIAEHVWGIPEWMKNKAMSYLTDEMRDAVQRFYEAMNKRPHYRRKERAAILVKAPISDKPYEPSDEQVLQAYETIEDYCIYASTGGRTGTIPMRVTPDRIERLGKRDVLVFGSNERGIHDGGVAKLAHRKFGAQYGQSEGLQGQSYAIISTSGLIRTAQGVEHFIRFATHHPELRFWVTAIGCGNAGHTPLQIAPLFRKAIALRNVYLPLSFWEYFWLTTDHGHEFSVSKDWQKWDR